MKTKLFILAGILLLVVAVLFGLPRHRTENVTVSFPVGRLMNMEGRSISYPFMDEIRIGTWRAEWEEGGIGEIRDYSWGRLVFRSMYYPDGQVMLRTQYRAGVPYGTWTKHFPSGMIQYRKEHDDSGLPAQELTYNEHGEIVLHFIEGKVAVDKLGVTDENGKAEPGDAENGGKPASDERTQ